MRSSSSRSSNRYCFKYVWKSLLWIILLIQSILFEWYYFHTYDAVDFNDAPVVKETPDSANKIVAKPSLLERYSSANPYPPFEKFQIPKRNRWKPNKDEVGTLNVNYTANILLDMGIEKSTLEDDVLLNELPPWSQVLQNYGDKPVVLGMERCKAYRRAVPPSLRIVGPAGLFSTGTNLLWQLMHDNCLSPSRRHINKYGGNHFNRFSQFQVPWGKHNPAQARLKHYTEKSMTVNQTSVLPVVMVRHPYTWLYALCQHPYSIGWRHNMENCERNLFLHQKAFIRFGAKGPDIPKSYDSLAHVWRDWNDAYFQAQGYPFLIARFEDMVFRPREVVSEVCSCIGGTMAKEFTAKTEKVNRGKGHGVHRSDLITAFVKYGKDLRKFETDMFTPRDWDVIRDVLSSSHGMVEAFGYDRE